MRKAGGPGDKLQISPLFGVPASHGPNTVKLFKRHPLAWQNTAYVTAGNNPGLAHAASLSLEGTAISRGCLIQPCGMPVITAHDQDRLVDLPLEARSSRADSVCGVDEPHIDCQGCERGDV